MNYSGSLTREHFMFHEMRIIARLKRDGINDEEIARYVFEENLFQYPTEREIKSKCRACLKRLACIMDMPVILSALAEGTLSEARQAALIAMMCQNRLVAEFMVCVIGEKYQSLDMTITRKDMNVFFQDLSERSETVSSWTENTISKIKSVLKNCLCEAGFISDSQSETLLPVLLPAEFEEDLKQAGHREFLPAFNVLDS